MSLRENITEKLKAAMRAKDELTVSTLRLVNAAIKDKDISVRTETNREGINDEQILSLFQTMIKQRHESVKMYNQGGRPELADRETAEIKIIESFMPKQLSDDEIKAVVESAIAAVSAASVKDMGKVMAELKAKYTGQLDFAKAGGMVKAALA